MLSSSTVRMAYSTHQSLNSDPGIPARARLRGFSLVEILIVLIVGSAIIAALLSAVLSVMKGSSGLNYYADMKVHSDRLIAYFEQDVKNADRIEFMTPGAGEELTFDLYRDDVWIAGYSYGVDPSPPAALDPNETWYQIWRHPNGGNKYPIARGFQEPPGLNFSGYGSNPVRSFFFFYNNQNMPFNHATAAGKRRVETGASKIQLNGIMQRGRKVDYTITHEVSSMVILRARMGSS